MRSHFSVASRVTRRTRPATRVTHSAHTHTSDRPMCARHQHSTAQHHQNRQRHYHYTTTSTSHQVRGATNVEVSTAQHWRRRRRRQRIRIAKRTNNDGINGIITGWILRWSRSSTTPRGGFVLLCRRRRRINQNTTTGEWVAGVPCAPHKSLYYKHTAHRWEGDDTAVWRMLNSRSHIEFVYEVIRLDISYLV